MAVDINGLGWEQLIAMRFMRDKLDTEASIIAKECDCSWEELFALVGKGLIDIGSERIAPKQMHPFITSKGIAVVLEAENQGII